VSTDLQEFLGLTTAIPKNLIAMIEHPKKIYQVLYVDDDDQQTDMVAEYFRLTGEFEPVMVGCLSDLWPLLATGQFDILVLDYILPDGNGLETIVEIQKQGYKIPIVLVTGLKDERIANAALQHGASDYILKTDDYLRSLPNILHKVMRSRELEESISRSMQQVRYQATLLNNVRDAIVVWDLNGEITYWNPAAIGLFGWNHIERLGKMVAEVYLDTFTPKISLPREGETIGHHIERQCQTKDGKTIWVSSRISALRDIQNNNRLLGYMDVSHDITKRKQMEAQIRAAQTQLTQAARLATIGEMASGIAHQIYNPLTTIIADAQLLLRALPADQPGRDSAEAIEAAGWRVQEVVQRLMEFSKPGSGAMDVLSTNTTIERALAMVSEQIRSAGIHLEVQLSSDPLLVRGSDRQLEDLWLNLLLLARDATSDDQPHHIKIQSCLGEQGWIVVTVSDDGAAIPQEDLETIFEPNFTGSAIGRGTGMELSICREIVRQHNGHVEVESIPRRDTIFRVSLPAHQSLD
jgi:two-component system, cell cycle sensor histidine kinase and response regulator CckA